MSAKAKNLIAMVVGTGLGLGVLAWQVSTLGAPGDPPGRLAANDDPRFERSFAEDKLAFGLPLPRRAGVDREAAALGEALFRDPRLSADSSQSCASCHDPDHGGDDGRSLSVQVGGTPTAFNATSVLYSRYNLLGTWRGESPALQAEIETLPHGSAELGSSPMLMRLRVSRDAELSRRFKAIYPQGVTPETIFDALETYLDSLAARPSRFDRYLRGDLEALTYQERQGYRMFRDIGCANCHQGRNLGGNMVQTLGLFEPWGGGPIQADEAGPRRFAATRRPEDRFAFRVASLRAVAETAPYFHDGSVERLDEAVRLMARHQLGRQLTQSEIGPLVAFLHTLSPEPAEAAPQ